MSLASTVHSHSQELQLQQLSHAGMVPPQINGEVELCRSKWPTLTWKGWSRANSFY